MNAKLFEDLVEGVREGGAILRGQVEGSRVFRATERDVPEIRSACGLSLGSVRDAAGDQRAHAQELEAA